MPTIVGIEFRDKTLHGWKKYSFVVRGKSAFNADKNSVLLSDIHRENPFMRGFYLIFICALLAMNVSVRME